MKKVQFNSKSFSEMIKAKREWEGTGLRNAAKNIGVSPATLSRIENGRLPDLINCKKICNYLNIGIDYFFLF